MLDALADELLPLIVAHIDPASWGATRLVCRSLHAAVMARAVTPSGLQDLLDLTYYQSPSPLLFAFDHRDTKSINLARSFFGLGPDETGYDFVVPFAKCNSRLMLALMEYAMVSKHDGTRYANHINKSTITSAEEVDAFMEASLQSHTRRYLGSVPGGPPIFAKCSPFNAHTFTLPSNVSSEWAEAATAKMLKRPICDRTVWSTMRWIMRGMVHDVVFTSFYFEFHHGMAGRMVGQLSPLIWEPKE